MLLVAAALPSLLIGLVAGVFVDRLDRKRLMVVSDLVRAVLSFSIPFLVSKDILLLYAIVLLSSSVGQFFNPAHESILPEIASTEELRAVNSWMAISGFGATTIGFAVCGIILAHFPLQWTFYMDALSFLISAICIGSIRVQSFSRSDRTHLDTVMTNLKDGGKYLLRNQALRSLFLLTIPVLLAFGLWNALLLPFTLHTLHATTFVYGIQEGLTCAAFVTGSLVVMRLGKRVHDGEWIVLSFLGMGLLGVDYALSANVPLAICLVMATGLMNAPYAIARRLIIQHNTHRAVRGRVNSVFFVARDAIYLAGMAAAGLADVWGMRSMMMVSALLLVGAGLAAFWMPGFVHARLGKAVSPAAELGSPNS
jgi:Na+/melibiose symporter-like transporter